MHLWIVVCAGASAEDHAGPQVVIETSRGNIVLLLDSRRAPITVANFLGYVDAGAYNETIFHRVVPGFVVQGGGYDSMLVEREADNPIHNEASNGLKNIRGSIAMARHDEIDSATNQFFINVADNERLDYSEQSCGRDDEAAENRARERGLYKPRNCKTFGYAVFGQVVEGMEVVDEIEVTATHSMDDFDDLPVAAVVIKSVRRM